MHYLKCLNCGHYNELKTEYLSFCTNCNKKMVNNYQDWIRENYDKSFDDYKKMVCTTDKNEGVENKRGAKKKLGLKYWIGFAVTFAGIAIATQLGGKVIKDFFNTTVYDKAMMEVASELNKSCPIMVDSETRFDNAIALPDNIFQYNYTLINVLKDSINVDEFKDFLDPTITNYVKSNPDMKMMRDRETTINYYYKDKTGIFLFTVSVTPDKYK